MQVHATGLQGAKKTQGDRTPKKIRSLAKMKGKLERKITGSCAVHRRKNSSNRDLTKANFPVNWAVLFSLILLSVVAVHLVRMQFFDLRGLCVSLCFLRNSNIQLLTQSIINYKM